MHGGKAIRREFPAMFSIADRAKKAQGKESGEEMSDDARLEMLTDAIKDSD